MVGIFESGGKAFESEIWVDVNSLASTTKRESFSSVVMRAKDQNALAALTKRITDDPKLHLKALSERTFYEDQQGIASGALKGLAVFISFIMAVGAGFAGMNTMYAAVARRTKEIGTLRVLGFSRFSILVAFLLESVGSCSDRCGDRDSVGDAIELCFDRHFKLGDVQRDCLQLSRHCGSHDHGVDLRRDHRFRRITVAVDSRVAFANC